MSPYLREEDVPEHACEGSFIELNWQGTWDDPTRPKEIVCPACGVKLTPEYESEREQRLLVSDAALASIRIDFALLSDCLIGLLDGC